MSKLILDYCPFTMTSNLFVVYDGDICERVKVDSFPNDLIDLVIRKAYSFNIYNIKICGPKDIIKEIGQEIEEKEKSMYPENKIKVEY